MLLLKPELPVIAQTHIEASQETHEGITLLILPVDSPPKPLLSLVCWQCEVRIFLLIRVH